MAEIATIARPYAEALFQANKANPDAALAWVEELGLVGENAQLQQHVANPAADVQKVFELICSILKSPLPESGKGFLRVLLENGRFAAMPTIARQFRTLRNNVTGVADATIYSAFPMDAAQVSELQQVLEQRFAKKLQLSVIVDSKLIGGVRVVVGDQVLDTSVQARLEKMKVALAE